MVVQLHPLLPAVLGSQPVHLSVTSSVASPQIQTIPMTTLVPIHTCTSTFDTCVHGSGMSRQPAAPPGDSSCHFCLVSPGARGCASSAFAPPPREAIDDDPQLLLLHHRNHREHHLLLLLRTTAYCTT
jgi:hypothetical protein